jgi:hypothetical protein
MQPTALMCRAVWWAFAVAGAAALVGALGIALEVAPAAVVTGVWQLVGGAAIMAAILRAPGGVAKAVPFIGAAVGGLILGAAGLLFPAHDPRIALIAIGIWTVVAGAGYRVAARIIRAFGAPDGGLWTISWIAIGWGAVVSTLPAWALGNSLLLITAATAVTGVVTLDAARRLRVVPEAAPEALSKREIQRRERAGGGRPG